MNLLPPETYLLNTVVSRIPYTSLRMRFYKMFRVKFESVSSGVIRMGTQTYMPENISFGLNSVVGKFCLLDARGGIYIGRNVSISSYTLLITGTHKTQSEDFEGYTAPIRIEDRVWIGTRAMILPGVTIGEGAVVAAGAVVSHDVEEFTIVGGVPARQIGQRSKNLSYELNWQPDWD